MRTHRSSAAGRKARPRSPIRGLDLTPLGVVRAAERRPDLGGPLEQPSGASGVPCRRELTRHLLEDDRPLLDHERPGRINPQGELESRVSSDGVPPPDGDAREIGVKDAYPHGIIEAFERAECLFEAGLRGRELPAFGREPAHLRMADGELEAVICRLEELHGPPIGVLGARPTQQPLGVA